MNVLLARRRNQALEPVLPSSWRVRPELGHVAPIPVVIGLFVCTLIFETDLPHLWYAQVFLAPLAIVKRTSRRGQRAKLDAYGPIAPQCKYGVGSTRSIQNRVDAAGDLTRSEPETKAPRLGPSNQPLGNDHIVRVLSAQRIHEARLIPESP